MTMTDGWLDGWDRVPDEQNYGSYRRPDLPLALLRHTWEGIGRTPQWHIDYVRKKMRLARPHFVAACPITTSLTYKKSYGGSKSRVSNIASREGYELLAQAQPTTGPSWSLRGIYEWVAGKKKPRTCIVDGRWVNVESNHANVWQTEFVSWAADMRNLTDAELEWERDNLWMPQVLAGGITEVVPWEAVGSSKKIPDEVWMSPSARAEFNFVGHQHMPPPNNHWDSGPYPYGEMSDELNRVLAVGAGHGIDTAPTTDVEAGKSVSKQTPTPASTPIDIGKARKQARALYKTLGGQP